MATFTATGALSFSVYDFSFAELFAEFGVVAFDQATTELKFSDAENPESFLVFAGITTFTSLAEPWGGTITSILYQRANVGQFTLSDFAFAATNFYAQSTANSRQFFATIFEANDVFDFALGQAKIEAGSGDDEINASTQDDFIVPGAGLDTINGGDGFDTLDYSNYSAASSGITVNVSGLGQGTVLDPGGSADGYSNVERIIGTAFSDTFNGGTSSAEQNEWVGGKGADLFNGGVGFDTINFDADKYAGQTPFNTGVVVNILHGTATDGFGYQDTFSSIEAIVATDLADNITGGVEKFVFTLRAGADQFMGGVADEWISPGAGDDTINGGAGFDTIDYSRNDSPPTNHDNNIDFIQGGMLVINGATRGAATIYDQYGNIDIVTNIEHINGSMQSDVFLGGQSFVSVTGNQGQDVFTNTALNSMTVDYSQEINLGGMNGVNINLLTGIVTDSFGDIDRVHGINNFRGTMYDDIFVGLHAVSTVFHAGDGSDTILLQNGNDWVAPGSGTDNIEGGLGYDQLNYASLQIQGDVGIEVVLRSTGQGEVIKTEQDTDSFSAIELIFGTSGKDHFDSGGFGGDFSGGEGSDTFVGGNTANTWDVVDFAAEKNHGGWKNGVIVNLSNATHALSTTKSINALSAIDSFGDLDALTYIDIIRGTGLNDIFIAGAKSIFEGGKGNDVYWLDGADSAIELTNSGTDLIYSKASMSLPQNIENLSLLGTASWAVGNSVNNVIKGNASNNSLSGGLGLDTLSGSLGRDYFRFDSKLSSSNRDTITDFSATYDQFIIDRSYFSKVGAVGKLSSQAFYIGSTAHDASDRIIYNKLNGALYYDADGTGSASKIQFATLSNKAAITYLDFDIIA